MSDDAPKRYQVWRRQARCAACSAYWTIIADDELCGCGGKLVPFSPSELEARRVAVPYIPMTISTPEKKTSP